jgi:hypothetical protein
MSLPRTSPTVERVCEWCQRPFTVDVRHTRQPRRGVMCSRACVSSFGAARRNAEHSQAGAGNNNWKGGVSTNHSRYTKRFIAKFPEKRRAQWTVRYALKSGRMVRPPTCSACQKVCKAHAHHDDYTKPYDVRWLCQQCHNAHHAAERAARKQAA